MLHKNNIPVVSELFVSDPQRSSRFSIKQAGWHLDYSRVPLTPEGLEALGRLPEEHQLARAVDRLFSGEPVNSSEIQPALHMALRSDSPGDFAGAQEGLALEADRGKMLDLAGRLHSGASGLTDILHIGIGGSDLGPRLVAEALDADDSAVRVHWLSTLDGRRFDRLCRQLDPARTGVVIASKSFSTEETLTQAEAARDWLGADWTARAWAATANTRRALEFGVGEEHVLAFPGWVGGRFSLWSSVGVSAAAQIGPDRFRALLAGAERADSDYRNGSWKDSLAVVFALLMHYLRRELDFGTLGIVSYEPRLALLADYLQQLVMESLGKGVDLDNRPVGAPTSPLIFGGRGTDLQHSIFQALHQGPDTHPLILVGSKGDDHGHPAWHRGQLAHLLAQAATLADGRSDGAPYTHLPGNRPAATLLVDRLRPGSLGWLLATLEHAVYTLSVLWHINPFDQWGVEEGKRLAAEIRKSLDSQSS